MGDKTVVNKIKDLEDVPKCWHLLRLSENMSIGDMIKRHKKTRIKQKPRDGPRFEILERRYL
jgi:hypothetical protein